MFVRENIPSSDGGVSEVIGFLIIFTIIILGISLVTLYGYPVLLQQQSSANERVMEKNMIVLQNDIKSLTYSMVPNSETSMSIGGGTLFVYNGTSSASPATFTVECDNGNTPVLPNSTGKIQYESVDAQTNIALENGAVVTRMTNINGSTMLAEPRWFYDAPTNTAAIYLIHFNTTSVMEKTGISTVAMERGIFYHLPPFQIPQGTTCTVSYSPDPTDDYSSAWNNYFATTFPAFSSPTTGKYTLLDNTRPGQIVIYQDDIDIKSV